MGNALGMECEERQDDGQPGKTCLEQLFSCHAAGYQRSCSFSPFGTYGVFGGADKKLRFVKTNWDMLRRPQERSVNLEGLIEWCSYTQEGVLLVVEVLQERRTLHAWAVVKSTKQVLSNELAVLDGTSANEVSGPYAVSQSGLHFVTGVRVPDVGHCIRVFTINLFKQPHSGLLFPLAYELQGFASPVDSTAFITPSMSLLTSAGGVLQLWDLAKFEDREQPNGAVTAVMSIASGGNKQEGSGLTEGAAEDGCLELLRSEDGQEILFQLSENEQVLATWTSPLNRTDGMMPAEAKDASMADGCKSLQLHQLAPDGKLTPTLALRTEDPIYCCELSHTGQWLAVGTGVKFGSRTQRSGRLQVFDVEDFATEKGTLTFPGAVNAVQFTGQLSCDKSSWGRCLCLAVATDGAKLATGECMIVAVGLEPEVKTSNFFDTACGSPFDAS